MAVLNWTEAQWHEHLSTEQFAVLRKEQDEPRGSHPLIQETRRGMYVCAGCYNPLFESNGKFSHRDYPSFYEANPGAVRLRPAFAGLGVPYVCAHCDGHQGHVHNDGPQPTGKRYANNGGALLFVSRGEKLPPLRS